MRAPLSWLRDYAPLDASVERLTEVLSELGLVVDGIEHVEDPGIADVVVARVLDIRPHPNADKIRIVDIDPGDGGPLQILCGAWNFQVGDLVPLAPVGAVLPALGGLKISKRKMRGEESFGMLCAASEIGLPTPPDAADGLLILPPDVAPPGTPLAMALGIEPDVVFDLDVTPNRPDALSVAGVARDVAAALGETFAWPSLPAPLSPDPTIGTAPVTVEAGELCPRFTATVMTGVPTGTSPDWIQHRLTLAGMRPISAVVDVSNYVMLDLGQPNHAYDLDRLGGGGLVVRRGRDGEKIETLDGVTRSLTPEDCVIASALGDPVGIGGVMGAAAAEINDSTSRILFEAAYFEPTAIARTGKRLGLSSEARTRFERGVDPGVASRAVARFASLLASIPGGEGLRIGPTTDVVSESLPTPPVVTLRTARVNGLLGTSLTDADLSRLLEPLGFGVTASASGAGVFDVVVPTWRLEVQREIDLVEEVARMWGYRRIARTVPAGSRRRSGGLTPRQRERRRAKQILAGAGFDEAWTTTFLAPGDLERAGLDPVAVEVENPLDRSESLLRTSLLPGLLKALKFNVDRQADGLALFEIGRVFAPPAPGATPQVPDESELLALVVAPPASPSAAGAGGGPVARAAVDRAQVDRVAVETAVRAWRWLASGLRLSGASLSLEAGPVPGLHPGRSAVVLGAGPTSRLRLGEVGEVDPDVVAAYGLSGRVGYLSISLDAIASAARRPGVAHDVSRYPASDVDLAFVAGEEVTAAALATVLEGAGGELVEDVTLFDVYRGERLGQGQRSLAFRIRFRAPRTTLSDSDLGSLRQKLIDAAAATGATLRQ